MRNASRDEQTTRESLRQARRALAPWRQQCHARQLARRWPRRLPRDTQRIAAYLASDGELDPAPLLRRLKRGGRRIYLPRWRRNGSLAFVRGVDRRQRFGVTQARGRAINARRLGLLLIPLVGFDEHGCRLGRGGGVYDRALHLRGGRRPPLIGLAHELQKLKRVKANTWDVPMDCVVTERCAAPRLLQRKKSR